MGLSNRLNAVCNLIETCDLIADIGTDHAYIPIELVKTKKVKRAIATDIVEGPLAIAEENVRSEGLEDRIEVFQSDGLANYKDPSLKPDYYIIAGMGGNTIIDILDGFLKNIAKDALMEVSPAEVSSAEVSTTNSTEQFKFILQPMTGKYELRTWLLEHGFEILCEKAVGEGAKFYNIVLVRYLKCFGSNSYAQAIVIEKQTLNEFELFFGKNPIEDEEYFQYLKFELKKARDILEKLKHSKEPDVEKCERLKRVIDALEKKISYSLK